MQLGERNWTEVPDLAQKVVVAPIGSLEQHGHHLPMLTDSMIGAEIARRAEAELGDEAVFLPMLWVGASDHHRAFPGTVSLTAEVYVRVLIDMVESLIGAGFRRIFLLNSHAGNVTPGHTALYDVQLRHRKDKPDLFLAFTSWFQIAGAQAAALEGIKQPSILHACEWETSMILRTHPNLVQKEAIRGARFSYPSAFFCPDHSAPSRVSVVRTIEQDTKTGAFGYPELATTEKGEALYAAATREVVAFIREFATWPPIEPA